MENIKLEKANAAYEKRKAEGQNVSISAIEKEFGIPAGKLGYWRSNRKRLKGSTASNAEVQEWPLERIRMRGNIRTEFDQAELQSLANSLRTSTLLQYPVGYVEEEDGGRFVTLVIGERRLRAHELRRDRGEEIDSMMVRVIPRPSEREFLTMNFVENVQRVNLKPSEEAAGMQQMLELVDSETGQAPFNVHTVADELGIYPQRVVDAVNSLRAPERARAALDEGAVSLQVVGKIGSLPEEVRERASDEIIFGVGGAMAEKEARTFIANTYRRDLRKAEFDKEDGTLTEAPACVDCEWYGGNRDDLQGASRAYQCLNPACFREKQAAAADRERERIMQEGGDVVLMTEEQCEKVFDDVTGRLAPNCGFVDLEAKPEPYFLADGDRNRASAPKWRTALGDDAPTIHVAWDQSGKRVDLVETGPAMVAALGNSYGSLFRPEAAKGFLTEGEEALQRQVKTAMDREGRAVCLEGAAELFRGLSRRAGGFDREIVRHLVELAAEQGLKADDFAFLCEMLEPDLPRSQMSARGFLDLVDHGFADEDELLALLTLLLQVRSLRYHGFEPWCEDGPMSSLCEAVGFRPADWWKKWKARRRAAERKAQKEAESEQEAAAAGQGE